MAVQILENIPRELYTGFDFSIFIYHRQYVSTSTEMYLVMVYFKEGPGCWRWRKSRDEGIRSKIVHQYRTVY